MTTLAAGCAVVDVLYKTKHIIVETPIRNLLNLSHVKPNRRVFYYCPEVAELEDPKLIADDLKLTDEAFPVVDESVQATSSVKSRQRTVTAFVRKLVLIDGHRNPLDIASQVLASIKAGNTDPTKNLFIIYSIIKDTLCKEFKKHDPTIKTYKDVKRKYPSTKFNANDIVTIDPSLGIPVHTADTRKAQDGRSREARKNRGKPKPKPEPQPRKRGPKVRRKLAGDKCNTCFHKREEHKLTKQGWGRCRGISDHRIHSWVAKNYSGPCTCVRFKERPIK